MKAKTLVVAFFFSVFPFTSNAEELQLERAIQIALAHNLEVANSLLDVSKATDRRAAYRTSLYPKLSFYALGSEQLTPLSITIAKGTLGNQYPGIGPIPARDVSYSSAGPTGYMIGRIAQPLSGIYKTRLNLKSLDFSKQIAQQKTRGKRQDVVRDVSQAYHNIQQVQSSLVATRETAQLYKEVERITGDYVAKQTALPSELMQAETSLAQVEESELALTNQESNLKESLNDLMGRDVLTEFEVTPMSDEMANINLDLASARKKALSQRAEVQQARLKVLQSEEELRAKHAEYIPDISAEFNAITLLSFNSFLPSGFYSIGLSLSWEPLDWGRKRSEMAEKRDVIAQDKNTETSAERKVIMDVDSKYRQMQLSCSKLRVARLSQKAAQENLRVDKNQYEVQAALLKVVFQAQSTVAQANSDFTHAIADYETAKADFEHALGDDQ